jgi:hypothetical protein
MEYLQDYMVDSSPNIVLLDSGWGRVSMIVQRYNGMPKWFEAMAGEVTSLYVVIALLVSGLLGSSQ